MSRNDKPKKPEAQGGAGKTSGGSSTPRLMTPQEVAEYLNITESQVYTLMRDGELLALKIGRRGVWRVDRHELERYIERLRQEAIDRISATTKKRGRNAAASSNRSAQRSAPRR